MIQRNVIIISIVLLKQVTLSLGDLNLSYPSYKASIYFIDVSGSMAVKVDSNSFYLQASVTLDGTDCKTSLDQAQVVDLSGYEVQMTGLGSASDWIADQVTSYLADQFSSDIRSAVNDNLADPLRQALEKVDICKLLSGQ
jgi:hypothetical protein